MELPKLKYWKSYNAFFVTIIFLLLFIGILSLISLHDIDKLKEPNKIAVILIVLSIAIASIISFYAIFILRKKIQLQLKKLDGAVEEQKRELSAASNKIKKREAELKTFLENIDNSACLLDENKKIVLFNDALRKNILALTNREPQTGGGLYDLVSADMRAHREKILDNVLQGNKETTEIEIDVNGRKVTWRGSFSPVITEGKVMGIVVITNDLTNIKEAESKFRALVEQSLVGVFIIQNDHFVYVNPKVLEDSGYSEEELLALPVNRVIHEDSINLVRMNANAKLPGDKLTTHSELRIVTKDGRIKWYDMFSAITEYEGGKAVIGKLVDTTDNKNSEEKIKKHEAELEALIDNVDGSASLLDSAKRYVIFNKQFIKEHERLTGVPPVPGMEVYDLFPPEVKAERHKMLDVVLQGNKKIVEADYIRSGRHVYYRTSFNPVIAGKQVVGVSTYSIDLTEIKEREIALGEAESRFRALVEKSLVGVYIIKDGNFVYTNPRITEETGYTEEELQASTMEIFVLAEDREVLRQHIAERLSGNTAFARCELRITGKAGQLLWFEMFGTAMQYQGGNAVIGTMINITDKKAIHDALEKSLANLKSIFDSTQIGYLLADRDTNVVALNTFFKENYLLQTGYAVNVGDKMMEVTLPEKRENLKRVLDKVATDSAQVEYETVFFVKGIPSHFNVFVSPVIGSSGLLGFCMVAIDITKRKKLELEREQIIKDIVQRNTELEHFGQIVSHNLRGPLSSILGLCNISQQGLPAAEIKSVIHGINESAQKLDSVIKELNNIISLKKEVNEPWSIINFGELISDIRTDLKALFENSGAVIVYDFKETQTLFTIWLYTYNILSQLITNAIKFRKSNTNPKISIAISSNDDKTTIIVADNGIGIDLEKYGDQVFLLNKRFTSTVEGKGLGLYVVKTLVELLRGKIGIQSKPDVGTTFTLSFPANQRAQ